MSLAETLQRAYKSTVRDAILLEKAERIAAGYPASGQHRIRELFEAGNRRSNAAADLIENQPAASGALYREAAIAYIGAILASRGEPFEFAASDAKRAFEQLDGVRGELAEPPPDLEEARKLLAVNDLLVLDRLSENEAARSVQAIANTVGWLHGSIEPRTVPQIRRLRILRLVVIGAAVLALLVWGGMSLFSPTNIALHKPVTQSSVHPNSTSPQGGLTDGSTSAAYGVHTNLEENPWVRVDLGAVYRLKKIKIFNRSDGWFDDCLPLTLELSENGTDFAQVDRRTTSFGAWSPWSYSAGGARARFIQVRGVKGKFVALGELEAFGKK